MSAWHLHLMTAATALLMTGLAAADDKVDGDGWKFLYDKDGIQGWSRIHEDSRFKEWRGEGEVEASFYRVVAVYMDSDRSDEWVADCLESVEVEKPDIDHQITYNLTHLPKPFWNRDFLWEDSFAFDMEKREVYGTMTDREHPDYPPKDDVVRGELLSSYFYARYIDEDTTFVEVRLHIDPGGKLPAWLVNAVSRSWPLVTFRDLREQVYNAEGYEELEQAIRDAHPMEP